MIEVPDPSEPSAPGALWSELDRRPRIGFFSLRRSQVPAKPGVYAVYRQGARVYVGRACGKHGLQGRIATDNSNAVGMHGSVLRRNVAQYLDIASADDIYTMNKLVSQEEARRVHEWVQACEVTWIVHYLRPQARRMEDQLRAEYTPPLARI